WASCSWASWASTAAGVGGLPGSGSAALSRVLSASWIAESAASVGSVIFFGLLAISVVASHYAGPQQRRVQVATAHERVMVLRSLQEPPRAAGSSTPRRHFPAATLSYRLGIPKETAC